MKAAHDRKRWLAAVSAYTLAGLASGAAVGALLGLAGRLVARGWGDGPLVLAAAGLAVLLAAREFGWISFPLPSPKRQTERIWAHEFGILGAAVLWGLHIGIGLNTRIRYGGYWLLVTIAVLGRDPRYGALLLAVYWLGRALPVWLAPLFVPAGRFDFAFLDALTGVETAHRRAHAWGLAWAALALGVWGWTP